MVKYPKTPRLSAVLPEDFQAWKKLTVVIEEKVDGANAAISFEDSNLILQSRGHILSGGPREIQFDLFKQWAAHNQGELYKILGDRFVAFGEWCYAKHRVFYDALPAWFIEFDIWDKKENLFLSTARRRSLLSGGPLTQVYEIHSGIFQKINNFEKYIGRSKYKSSRNQERFVTLMKEGLDQHYAWWEIDTTDLAEGIYVKIEDEHQVISRMKLHREEFEKTKIDEDKWLRRPIFPNQLL